MSVLQDELSQLAINTRHRKTFSFSFFFNMPASIYSLFSSLFLKKREREYMPA
jgi:hypothetical protein